ncbi:transcription factor GTE9 isoform X1 [Senna tora]|uniref:Transcription factor GTE9 isoform X1 n=1 Tax=Senna tora TaxID=362788 RepID=A0A834TR05_9FABA|nr:transcription factor GTE9 isoform X1 [Senna tora]
MKTISKLQEEEPTFSSMSRSSGKRKPPDDNNYYAESLLHEKRQRVFSEAHKDSCGDDDSETKEASTMVGLEAIQWKLDKGMYLKADEFADEIRLMLSNVKLYDSKIRGIHRMAMKLREEFEKRWESMKESFSEGSKKP